MANGQPLRKNPRPAAGGAAAGPGAARRPGTRPGSAARPDPRRGPPKKAQTPIWMWLVLIVLPAVLIGVLFFVNQGGGEPQETAPKPKVVDPNERIDKLQAEVAKIEGEVKQVHKLRTSGDATAKAKAQTLRDRLDRWMADWDEAMQPLLDAEGKLPPEYRGYQASRGRINTARLDLLKIMEFE
jgi:hypothetical protein